MSSENLKRQSNECSRLTEEENNRSQNINSISNFNTTNQPSFSEPVINKKKVKLGFKKDSESEVYTSNANECIYFKIIHSKEEFYEFQNLNNFQFCFNPSYTNQIFNDTETITGYKNLKILVSLTPKLLFPHFKFVFEKCSKVKDDLELVFKTHFEHTYETDEGKFIEKLEKEIGKEKEDEDGVNQIMAPIGKLISSEENKNLGKKLEVKLKIIANNFSFIKISI